MHKYYWFTKEKELWMLLTYFILKNSNPAMKMFTLDGSNKPHPTNVLGPDSSTLPAGWHWPGTVLEPDSPTLPAGWHWPGMGVFSLCYFFSSYSDPMITLSIYPYCISRYQSWQLERKKNWVTKTKPWPWYLIYWLSCLKMAFFS